MLREYKNRIRSIYLCPTVVAERTKKVRGNTLDHSLYIYIYILLFLTPKQWHNLPSSSLSINAITCKAKYIYGTLFLSPQGDSIKSTLKCKNLCSFASFAFKQILFYVEDNNHTFMVRLKLLLCLLKKKKKQVQFTAQKCNLKSRYYFVLMPFILQKC